MVRDSTSMVSGLGCGDAVGAGQIGYNGGIRAHRRRRAACLRGALAARRIQFRHVAVQSLYAPGKFVIPEGSGRAVSAATSTLYRVLCSPCQHLCIRFQSHQGNALVDLARQPHRLPTTDTPSTTDTTTPKCASDIVCLHLLSVAGGCRYLPCAALLLREFLDL